MTMADLLPRLTLAEKARVVLGSTMWHTAPVPRLGIPAVMLSDGPHGLRRQPDGNHAGISGSLPATCFPTASALGSSWDPVLVRRVGQAIGAEARAQGVAVVLGPGVNIKRSPLCGRNFEYFAEDPLLAGVLGEAHVVGVQSQGVGACVKHFAVNNQETDRLRVSADVDERTLREIYLPHFERIVTGARPWMVMCAYNRVNGVHASEHRWLLTEVLRDEWGFDGVVVSDWGAVHDRVAALAAGLDLETWLSGQAAGGAVADLLLGAANPSGRLAESLPLRLADNPSYLNFPGEQGHVRYGEGVFVGYRGYDATGREVAYPFGHGLSYTTFAYHDLTVTVTGRADDGDLALLVTCTVVNTGDRPGKEVVQLYAGAPATQVARPVRELKAFAKIDLAPGAGETVTFQLDARDLSYWSARHRRWVFEGGVFQVSVGASSRDLRLTATADVPAAPVRPRLTAEATLREWLADPDGAAVLAKAIGVATDGRPNGILGDEETRVVLGDFPLRTLTTFPGLGIDHAVLAEVTASLR